MIKIIELGVLEWTGYNLYFTLNQFYLGPDGLFVNLP